MGSTRVNGVRLSRSEERLIGLLPLSERKRVSTKDLLSRFYDGREAPFNARIVLSATLRSLGAKLEARSSWRLRRTARAGPYPMEVWLEKRRVA